MERNQRGEDRFPCVLFGRYHSLEHGMAVRHVAAGKLREAALRDLSLRGMSMDIGEAFRVGERLLIVLPVDEEQKEQLVTQVRWCRGMSQGYFRVGVEIEPADSHAIRTVSDGVARRQEGTLPAPHSARFVCPACAGHAHFLHHGEQILAEGSMPLYSCDACGSTRSIGSLLRQARRPS